MWRSHRVLPEIWVLCANRHGVQKKRVNGTYLDGWIKWTTRVSLFIGPNESRETIIAEIRYYMDDAGELSPLSRFFDVVWNVEMREKKKLIFFFFFTSHNAISRSLFYICMHPETRSRNAQIMIFSPPVYFDKSLRITQFLLRCLAESLQE